MIQCICDICGKIIPDKDHRYSLSIVTSTVLPTGVILDDVCPKCAEEVNNYICKKKRGYSVYGVKSTDAGTEVFE